MLCRAVLYRAMLCRAVLCRAMLCCAVPTPFGALRYAGSSNFRLPFSRAPGTFLELPHSQENCLNLNLLS
jgi:hypothetical protein